MSIQLLSQRLILRTIDVQDSDKVLDFVIRNKQFLGGWEPVRQPEYYSLDAQRQLIDQEIANIGSGSLFKVWMFKKEDSERVIGSVGLSNIVRGAFQSCHLGYRIDRMEQNMGYMTEAVREVVNYGFTELKLHRIEANIMPRNQASMRVVQKLGFEDEGLSRKYLRINGNWEDHRHMVLLNNEVE